jgi:hypothetical protein
MEREGQNRLWILLFDQIARYPYSSFPSVSNYYITTVSCLWTFFFLSAVYCLGIVEKSSCLCISNLWIAHDYRYFLFSREGQTVDYFLRCLTLLLVDVAGAEIVSSSSNSSSSSPSVI